MGEFFDIVQVGTGLSWIFICCDKIAQKYCQQTTSKSSIESSFFHYRAVHLLLLCCRSSLSLRIKIFVFWTLKWWNCSSGIITCYHTSMVHSTYTWLNKYGWQYATFWSQKIKLKPYKAKIPQVNYLLRFCFLMIKPVLGICDILVRIRIWILGFIPLANGSGSGYNSGSDAFLQWL